MLGPELRGLYHWLDMHLARGTLTEPLLRSALIRLGGIAVEVEALEESLIPPDLCRPALPPDPEGKVVRLPVRRRTPPPGEPA